VADDAVGNHLGHLAVGLLLRANSVDLPLADGARHHRPWSQRRPSRQSEVDDALELLSKGGEILSKGGEDLK
jgi:hypothetical protein